MVKRRLNYELTDDKRRKRTTDTNKTSKNFFCIILIILVSIGLTTAFLGSREGNYQLFTLMLIGLGASFIGILAGGGGLITVLGMMLTGIPIQTRIATNKFSSGIAALSSVFYLIRNKQLNVHFLLITILIAVLDGFINGYYAICMAVGSIIGSQIGLLVLPKVSQKAAKTLLVVIISALMLQMIVKII